MLSSMYLCIMSARELYEGMSATRGMLCAVACSVHMRILQHGILCCRGQ